MRVHRVFACDGATISAQKIGVTVNSLQLVWPSANESQWELRKSLVQIIAQFSSTVILCYVSYTDSIE